MRTASDCTWTWRRLGERREHGVAQAALGPVVLDGDDAAGRPGRLDRVAGVERLDRVEVDDACLDAVGGERLGGGQCLVQGDARRRRA